MADNILSEITASLEAVRRRETFDIYEESVRTEADYIQKYSDPKNAEIFRFCFSDPVMRSNSLY